MTPPLSPTPKGQSPVNMADVTSVFEPQREQIIQSWFAALKSGQFINGPNIQKIENQVAEFVGVKHGIAVSNGTAALYLACHSLGIKRGDCVVTTPYSFFASASAPALCGARLSFVDVNKSTFNIDPDSLEVRLAQLKEHGIKPKAIIVVHLFGQCAEMESILSIAKRYEVRVIEDAAQAIGAYCQVKGSRQNAGSIGKIGCLSFYPTKNLGAPGDFGMVVTDSDKIARRIRLLANQGSTVPYEHKILGQNFRANELMAASLLIQLPHLSNMNEQRIVNARFYCCALAQLETKGMITLPVVLGKEFGHVFHHFVIQARDRDSLKTTLNELGIQTAVYYPKPLHQQKALERRIIGNNIMPIAEELSKNSLALPIHPGLNKNDLERVVSAIEKHYAFALDT